MTGVQLRYASLHWDVVVVVVVVVVLGIEVAIVEQ